MSREEQLNKVLEKMDEDMLLSYFRLLERCKELKITTPTTLKKIYGKEEWDADMMQVNKFGEYISELATIRAIPLMHSGETTSNHKLYVSDPNFSLKE